MAKAVIDIGMGSYNNSQRLQEAVSHLMANTTGEWRLLIVDNASSDPDIRPILESYADHPSITVQFNDVNVGYAGAVNQVLRWSEAPWVAWCDNDCNLVTHGWNQSLVELLSTHHEVGMVGPATYASYLIDGPGYAEALWIMGCMWMINRGRLVDVGYFDEELGHQEEVDYAIRMRLAGWRLAVSPEVSIHHYGSSTANPEPSNQQRINDGIVRWVNKWNAYFSGKDVTYHSPNVLRFEDWPVVALYRERFFQEHAPWLAERNRNPEQATINGQPYDLILVPRWPGLYRTRGGV